MNDVELDRLLDSWVLPAPPPSLRAGVRARFPRSRPGSFAQPLRWVLAIAIASMALAIATGQSGPGSLDFLWTPLRRLYLGLRFNIDTREASAIRARIRQSNPRVYVDGQPAPPPQYRGGLSVFVVLPGGREFGILLVQPPGANWQRVGTIHGNVIQFEADGKQVRIECDKAVVDADRPVYT
ncbi:MAG TPA: hypothetical protein VGS58_16850, partial [Candidatus Sulfopaludibacter sp.]|nr:hypothetical protein [Candidatus Sulfopaludibacter sp.]